MEVDELAPLSQTLIKYVKNVVWTLLYYSRSAVLPLAEAFIEIAERQSKRTEDFLISCYQFLDYVASHSHAAVLFLASDMILEVQSDASYLS